MREYYDARAPEYDEWYLGLGRFDGVDRPHWDDELIELEHAIAALPAKRTLDVACGTAFVTRHLLGEVTGVDQSERMLAIARMRMPRARFVIGDALDLSFANLSFERVFTGHFYGHLEFEDRLRFLAEARRVAPELVMLDAARRPDRHPVEWQKRTLNDNSRHEVYKRYFQAERLADELGGGRVLFDGRWFVLVASP
jgi:demethylmenaquinone methyltransferase/2-methoxy-6-polyprenyl-1,4-benzoquinol methylase